MCVSCGFFFQAEDGIRDLVRSRGLGDVYKRQLLPCGSDRRGGQLHGEHAGARLEQYGTARSTAQRLSLIHI